MQPLHTDRPDCTVPCEEPLPGARGALFLLLAINLFNYIDRQVLAAVVPDIRRVFHQSDAQIGMLSMAFMVVYMTCAPLFARLAERWSRWMIVGAAVIAWSVATGVSGLAITFGMLFLTRCFVGVGEAAYAPVAQAMLSDLYPISKRGRILAWFNMAIPVGSALGLVLGGYMTGRWPENGWRWAFGLVVLPGLVLGGLAILRGRRTNFVGRFVDKVPDKAPDKMTAQPSGNPRGNAAATVALRSRLHDYLRLLRTPSYFLCTAGMCCSTFAIGGIGFWMVDYVKHRTEDPHAAVIFGLIVVVSGLTATLLGGMLGDRLRRRWGGAYFLVSGVGMLLGFPIFLLVLNESIPFPFTWVFIFLTCFCLFFNTGPTNAILANVNRPALRPMAFALNILLIHALGDVPSPFIIGLIADQFGGDLNVAFRAVALMFILSGVFWLLGARFLARDTARAEEEEKSLVIGQ